MSYSHLNATRRNGRSRDRETRLKISQQQKPFKFYVGTRPPTRGLYRGRDRAIARGRPAPADPRHDTRNRRRRAKPAQAKPAKHRSSVEVDELWPAAGVAGAGAAAAANESKATDGDMDCDSDSDLGSRISLHAPM